MCFISTCDIHNATTSRKDAGASVCIVLLKTLVHKVFLWKHSGFCKKKKKKKAHYPWTHLFITSSAMWMWRERYNAIWRRNKNLLKVAVVCAVLPFTKTQGSAGWKQPTQNNISSVHSSQPKHQFPYYICHWDFSFPLLCENSVKGLLTSLSNKRVTVINGVGYREKNSSMVVCCCHLSLTIQTMFRFKLKHESGGQIRAAAPVRIL